MSLSQRDASTATVVGPSVPTATPALEVRGVDCAIGRRVILTAIDLEVRAGEVFGIVGANGSGKSTLLRALAGIRPAVRGDVLVDGRRLSTLRSRERARQIAFVAQESAAPADLLVAEMVALGRVPHLRASGGLDDTSRLVVDEALRRVSLDHVAQQPLDRLSGGERRRAVIARGLAQEAPLLLLDEPTNHLDIHHQLTLMRLIRSLDKTVLLAIHDLDLAATFCDRIAVLHDGALLACGTPDEVLVPHVLHDAFGVLATRVTHPLTGRTHLLFSHDEREQHP